MDSRHGSDYSYPADLFVNAGVNSSALDFIAVDAANATSDRWPIRSGAGSPGSTRCGIFGGDAKRFYIGGHSSAAHLAGVAMVTDWQKDFGCRPT